CSVDRVVAYDVKCVLRAVRGFDDNSLAVFTDLSDRAGYRVHAIFTHLIHFHGCLFRSLHRVMGNNFRPFCEPVEGVLGAGSSVFGAVDGGRGDEMKCVLGAVSGFDSDGLGRGVDLRNRAVDRGYYVFIRARGQKKKASDGEESSRTLEKFEHGGTPPMSKLRISLRKNDDSTGSPKNDEKCRSPKATRRKW